MRTPAWCVILAAGSGRRLAGVTGGVPKQFWAPPGGTTLLESTVARLETMTPLSRTVTVIDRSHADFARRIAEGRPIGHLAAQPMDRGTAAGVLFGLSAVGLDTDAVVLLTPSDHGIENTALFHRGIRAASRAVRTGQAGIVLLAARPSAPVGDYGWIVPAGRVAGTDLRHVGTFVEKPADALARRLYESGGVWNTMVMVARVAALLDLYREHLPALSDVFRTAADMRPPQRAEFLANRYPSLASADFSRDLVAPARGLHLHVWPASLGWTDLGTPERLLGWLTSQNRQPSVAGASSAGAHTPAVA